MPLRTLWITHTHRIPCHSPRAYAPCSLYITMPLLYRIPRRRKPSTSFIIERRAVPSTVVAGIVFELPPPVLAKHKHFDTRGSCDLFFVIGIPMTANYLGHICLCLHIKHTRISPTDIQQLIMSALFDKPPLIENVDIVCFSYSAEAV